MIRLDYSWHLNVLFLLHPCSCHRCRLEARTLLVTSMIYLTQICNLVHWINLGLQGWVPNSSPWVLPSTSLIYEATCSMRLIKVALVHCLNQLSVPINHLSRLRVWCLDPSFIFCRILTRVWRNGNWSLWSCQVTLSSFVLSRRGWLFDIYWRLNYRFQLFIWSTDFLFREFISDWLKENIAVFLVLRNIFAHSFEIVRLV